MQMIFLEELMNILNRGRSHKRDISKKLDNFFKSKHKSYFLIKLKTIENIMRFI